MNHSNSQIPFDLFVQDSLDYPVADESDVIAFLQDTENENPPKKMKLSEKTIPLCEVCVDSVKSAIEAEKGGASRIELCDSLVEGGTTPSSGMMKTVKSRISIPLHVIIRPRGGDFHYSEEEFEVMKKDVEYCKELGVSGVVFGILNIDGSVDILRNKELFKLAQPMQATFHRAFDMTRDPHEALEDIIDIGFERILTSGQAKDCMEGLPVLRQLVQKAGNRIVVMPGGGINESNLKRVLSVCHPKEFHISGRITIPSKMRFQNHGCVMGGPVRRNPEYTLQVADSNRIKEFLKIAHSV